MESFLECDHFSATRHNKAARGAHSVRRVGAAALRQAPPRCLPCGSALQAGRKGQASIKADPFWPVSGSGGLPPSRQLSRSAVGMVLPGHRYGTRTATGLLPPPPSGLLSDVAPPAAVAPGSSSAVFVVDGRSARQATWVQKWTTREVLRAARGRVRKRKNLRAAGARKLAAAVLAAGDRATCRKASRGLAQACYRTRRLLVENSPKWAWATAPRGVRRTPPLCAERRRTPPRAVRAAMRRWRRERRAAATRHNKDGGP